MDNSLSLENFYPDCIHCGTPGWASVIQDTYSPNRLKGDWRSWHCIECNRQFRTPRGSPWFGVWELTDSEFKVYTYTVIMDFTVPEAAKRLRPCEETVRRQRKRSRKKVERADRDGGEPAVVGGD